MPLDVGIIVSNSEALLNIYRALFLGKPVTTKFLNVYGEDVDRLKVYEAPIQRYSQRLIPWLVASVLEPARRVFGRYRR